LGIPAWELMVLLREVVLNSEGSNLKSINNQADLASVINHIKSFDEITSNPDITNVLLQLHRIAHLQFPWQRSTNINVLLRYLKIYKNGELSEIILEKLGLLPIQIMILGLLLQRHFKSNSKLDLNSFIKGHPHSNNEIYAYLKKLTIDIDDLKFILKESQQYDERWMYTWNPLESTPLITLEKNNYNLVYCPFPDLLHKRITEGVYFDIVENSTKFSQSFGISFQEYVGEVLEAVFSSSNYNVIPESEFKKGKKIHHGIDWILSDETANLFIECKTKRLRLDSKVELESASLIKDLDTLSDAIVQTYKNINFALNGESNWKKNENPIYPVIITLEDWFLLSPPIKVDIEGRVKDKLVKSGLPIGLIKNMPYTITSVNSFELASHSIFETGIKTFMSLKLNEEYDGWDLKEFSNQVFPITKVKKRFIFPEELELFKEEARKLCP
jgi:hypothetical protein